MGRYKGRAVSSPKLELVNTLSFPGTLDTRSAHHPNLESSLSTTHIATDLSALGSKLDSSATTMTYNVHRYETLRRLGVEQLPVLCTTHREHDDIIRPFDGSLPIRTMPVRHLRARPTSNRKTN